MPKKICKDQSFLICSLMLLGSILFACQFPGLLLEKISQEDVPTKSLVITSAYDPSQTTDPYPSIPTPQETQVHPQATEAENIPTQAASAYPAPQISQESYTLTQNTQETTPDGTLTLVDTISPTEISTQLGVYPGPVSTLLTATSLGAYPNPALTALTATPTSVYSAVSATPTPTSFQATPSLSPMNTTAAIGTVSPTMVDTSTPVLVLTSTSSTTPVYYSTNTPNPTPLPTFTATILPLPPWMRSQLRATDPKDVQLRSGEIQLIEFFAYWSGPSKAMAPLVHSLEKDYSEQIGFVYLDIDNPVNDTFKKSLGYKKEPHFFLLDKEGRIIKEWIGYVSFDDFLDAFAPFIHQVTPTVIGFIISNWLFN